MEPERESTIGLSSLEVIKRLSDLSDRALALELVAPADSRTLEFIDDVIVRRAKDQGVTKEFMKEVLLTFWNDDAEVFRAVTVFIDSLGVYHYTSMETEEEKIAMLAPEAQSKAVLHFHPEWKVVRMVVWPPKRY